MGSGGTHLPLPPGKLVEKMGPELIIFNTNSYVTKRIDSDPIFSIIKTSYLVILWYSVSVSVTELCSHLLTCLLKSRRQLNNF